MEIIIPTNSNSLELEFKSTVSDGDRVWIGANSRGIHEDKNLDIIRKIKVDLSRTGCGPVIIHASDTGSDNFVKVDIKNVETGKIYKNVKLKQGEYGFLIIKKN